MSTAAYWSTKKPSQGERREGRLGVPLPGKGRRSPALVRSVRPGCPGGSFPPFSSSFSRVNFPKPALPVSHRNRACMCVHYIISEESICSRLVSHQEALSICQQPAPLHYKHKDKSSRCISPASASTDNTNKLIVHHRKQPRGVQEGKMCSLFH